MITRGGYWWINTLVLACIANHGLSVALQISTIPSSGAPQGDTKLHTVSGVVINSVTRQPIPRVLVQLGDQQSTFTDRDGRFEFDAVTEQGGNLVSTKPGFSQVDYVTPSADTTLQLVPEAILLGTIRDQSGSPVQDMPIHLKMQQVYSGAEHWSQIQETTTNAEGEFRFAELRAGKYLLSTGFFVDGLQSAASSPAFLPSTYPPLSGDRAASAIMLKPGDRTEASVNVSSETVYPVRIRVNGTSNLQVNFEATTNDGDSLFPPTRFDPTSGTFQLKLPSGTYHLTARSLGREQLIGTKEITVGQGPLEGLSIALAPLTTLPLEVEYQTARTGAQDAQAKPSGEFYFETPGSAATRQVSAQPKMAQGSTQPPAPDAPRFFQNVEPDRYELRAVIAAPWYLVSATCGSLDLTREPLVLAADAGACTVRAILRDDSATLTWSIAPESTGTEGKDETQLPPVMVEAIPLDNLTQSVSFSSAPPSGGSLDLPPGRYLVLALQQQQEIPFRSPEALQRYLPSGQQVTLDRNGKSEIQLRLVKGDL
jgi:hypothetical protein